MPNLVDLTGRRFVRLIVVARAGTKWRGASWLCRCDCGKEKVVAGKNLGKGGTVSCGCLNSEQTAARSAINNATHGATKGGGSRFGYTSWTGMKQRCYNPKHPAFKNYGARGILMSKRWMKFENFLADMGPRPNGQPRMTIERKDNDKGYCKSNCRWATYSEQAFNRRPKTKTNKTKG